VGQTISPGRNVGLGRDFTLFALVTGQVAYEWENKKKRRVSVYPAES
jgi:large subunit ribosomal protein L27